MPKPFKLASEPPRILRISTARVFLNPMSDGTITAALDVEPSVNNAACTSRHALRDLALALRGMADEIDQLASEIK